MDDMPSHERQTSSTSYTNPQYLASSQQRRQKSRDQLSGSTKRTARIPQDESDSDASMSLSDEMELDLMSENSEAEDESIGMTKAKRSKRTRKRRQSEDLDVNTSEQRSPTESRLQLADRGMLRNLAVNSLLVASWYSFSLSISIYNKWMFSPKYLDFHFPLFTTCLHMLVQFCLALLVLYLIPSLRPRNNETSPDSKEPIPLRAVLFSEKPLITRLFYLTRIGPCGAATGLDIGLGNMSLKFITLTFYTMCKSSSLAFVLTFAFIFRLETPSVKLVTIIAAMTVGVIMMVAGEVEFNALGFVLVILAALFSGFRWSLTQILLLRSSATSNPFSSIFFLAPVMFLSLGIIAIPVEGLPSLIQGLGTLIHQKGFVFASCILLFPGLLAFLMTASEFALLKRTSVVTLSICGILKEVVTISAASIVFHDDLTPINVSGLLITIASIAAYNYIKIKKMREDARVEVDNRQNGTPENHVHEDGLAEAQPMLHDAESRAANGSGLNGPLENPGQKM